MADYYLDVSAPGNEYQAYAAVPTWSGGATDKPLPMDGNGMDGPGHSAAVAIAEIQITALPADGNTLTIAGAVLTAKTTAAAKNQWTIGGSIATCVSNLVSLINTPGTGASQCDAAVSSSACKLVLSLPYWVYARVKPGTTDTLQIATRFAGADLNYAGGANSYMLITTSGWGTPPTITQFAGGADGPFAYFVNTPTIGTIFSKAQYAYGLIIAAPGTPSEPGTSDVIFVRTKRGTSNLGVTHDAGGAAIGWTISTSKNRIFVFDDGSQWSGDSGSFLWLNKYGNSASAWNATLETSGVLKFLGAKSDRSSLLIRFTSEYTNTGNNNNSVTFSSRSSGSFTIEQATIDRSLGASNGLISLNLLGSTATTSYAQLRNSLVSWTYNLSIAPTQAGNNQPHTVFTGNEFAISGLSGPYSLNLGGSSLVPTTFRCTFNNNLVRDADGTGFKMTNLFGSALGSCTNCIVECVGNEGVEDAAPGFSGAAATNQLLTFIKADSARSHRIATGRMTADWDAAASPAFPTRNSVSPNGSPYSERITTTTNGSASQPIQVFRATKKYTGSTATKTVTVELLTKDTDAWKRGELFIDVQYFNASGSMVVESSKEADWLKHSGSATALATGSGGWTGTPTGYSSTKVAVTTSQAVKANTEVVVTVYFQRALATAFYIEPEFTIA